MRIQHNIAALNSYRNLGVNNSGVAKNLEKLSSGYRINRAGDDAAGLAISEKMRSQITGLNTAVKNANDGISLVQTAEGALTEVHSMLNRMVEIATQSANGVYEDGVDRQALQDEMNALTSEIDRIADGTNFNKKNLLDGSMDTGRSAKYSASAGADQAGLDITFDFADKFDNNDITVSFAASKDATTDKITIAANGAITYTVGIQTDGANTLSAGKSAEDVKAEIKAAAADANINQVPAAKKEAYMELINSMTVTGQGILKMESNTAGVPDSNDAFGSITAKLEAATDANDPKKMNLQIGDTNKEFNQLKLRIRDMHAEKLGVHKLKEEGGVKTGISVATESDAQNAIDAINTAINKVSTQRGELGAIQNRLEHTINNLSVNAENMTAAESRIRDVDMADEMMKYTKNNILVQASQAMLAQANQVPQGVLQLLQ